MCVCALKLAVNIFIAFQDTKTESTYIYTTYVQLAPIECRGIRFIDTIVTNVINSLQVIYNFSDVLLLPHR